MNTPQPRPRPHRPIPQRDVLRLPEVQKQFCPLCETQIRTLMSLNQFPQSIAIGPRAVAWRRSDLEAWQSEMSAKRKAQLAKRKQAREAASVTA